MPTVVSQTQKIVVNPPSGSVSIINAGPMGPTGPVGPSEASLVLTVDGQLLTRVGGVLVPITRANLATDLVDESAFVAFGDLLVPKSVLTADGQLLTRASGVVAPITRAQLASDSAFSSLYAPIGPHRVYAKHNTADSFTVTGTPTVIPLASEVYDHATTPFHDNTTNNSRLTIPSGLDGLYQVEARVLLNYGGTLSTVVGLAVRVNAATDNNRNLNEVFPVTATTVTTFLVNGQMLLVAGDYVEMFVSQATGTSVTTVGNATSTQATSIKITRVSG